MAQLPLQPRNVDASWKFVVDPREVVSGPLAEFHLGSLSNQSPQMGWGCGPGSWGGGLIWPRWTGAEHCVRCGRSRFTEVTSCSDQFATANHGRMQLRHLRFPLSQASSAVDCWLCVARPSTPLYHSLLHCGWKQKFSRSMTKTGKIVGRNAECWSTSVKCELKKNEFYRNTFPTYVTVSQQADFLNNIWW